MPKRPTANAKENATTTTGKKKKGKFKVAYTNRKAAKLLSESGSNELSKEDLSYLTDEEKLLLSSWELPQTVLAKYRAKGITSLFKWQLDCLANENVLKGQNLVYSAPTSAGKTLVAEILMIKRVLELGRKAIMILPFVAVAREKMYNLQELYEDCGIRVEGFMGSYSPPGGFKAVDIAICTIEKANSLINRLLEEGSLSQLGTIVVDELHLLGDPNRGYLLELLLTKIRYMTSRKTEEHVDAITSPQSESCDTERLSNNLSIQVIGMSATLPNLELLAVWLQAELVITNFRPVPLVERIKIGDKICDALLTPVRDVHLETLPISIPNDFDDVVYLTLETISEGHSLIIFCPSKKMCEQTAEFIAREFYNIGNPSSVAPEGIGDMLRNQLNSNKISEIVAQLSQCPGGMDEVLGKCVAFGVAFHHAGLTYDERDIVESGFKRGVIRVIVATSTLSAGVNLPARRVIIRTPNFNSGLLDILTYRQMSGRAGRQGIDTEGESILICSGATQQVGVQLIQSSLPAVTSALVGAGQRGYLTSSMKRAIIEVISSGIATAPSQIHGYSKCTLLSHSIAVEENSKQEGEEECSCSQDDMDSIVEECLKFLEENDFIRLRTFEDKTKSDEYMPTQLGSACLASSLSPDEGIIVFKELEKARRCFVLENELHVIYQVTPIYLADQWRNIDWSQFLNVWQELSLHERKVAELVGVEESFILRAMVGIVSRRNPKQASQLAIHQRFFTALALNDLVNELPISDVAEKYGVNKGVVQNLQQAASTFAGMVTVFCGRLGWSNLELLLSQFQERLQFGVQRELCDLVRLSLVNGQRARILYNAGIKTIAELAASEPAQVEEHLHKSGPFSSAAHGQNSKSVWVLGKKDGLSERDAAHQIVNEARTFLQIELGLPENIEFYKGSPEKPRAEELSIHFHNTSKIINNNLNSRIHDNDLKESDTSLNLHITTNEPSNSKEIVTEIQSTIQNGRIPASSRIFEPGSSFSNWTDFLNDNVFEESFTAVSDHRNSSMTEESSLLKKRPRTDNEFSNLFTDGPLASTPEQELINLSKFDDEPDYDGPTISSETPNEQIPISDVQNSQPETKMNDCNLSSQVHNSQNHDVLMSSLVSMMETSLHMSWNGENEVSGAEIKQNDFNSSNKTIDNSIINRAHSSEDMFANEVAVNDNVVRTDKRCSSSSNEILNDSSEVKEIDEPQNIHPIYNSTPRSSKNRESLGSTDLEEEYDKLGSLHVLETRNILRPLIDIQEFQSKPDGSGLKLKIVESPEFLPESIYSNCDFVAVGLNLSREKRACSTPRSAIGSRILGKRLSASTQRTPKSRSSSLEDDEDNLSISLFSGSGDTIWCYRWKQKENGSVVRAGRLAASNNFQFQLANIFHRIQSHNIPIVMINAKEKLKNIVKYCGTHLAFDKIPSQIYDPRIANWLMQCDENKFLTLDEMVDLLLDNSDRSLRTSKWSKDAIESYFCWKIMSVLKQRLVDLKLWNHFIEVEIPSIRPLILMELNGFGLDHKELERVKRILEFETAVLELKAYQIAGKQFNLSSAKDIRQILFQQIGLKCEKTRGTGKDVLKRIDHELARLIMDWRKITCALKILAPFLHDRNFDTNRVHGHYSYFTLTGRVMMAEPSLQLIPRDFYINTRLSAEQVERLRHDCEIKFGLKLTTLLGRLENKQQAALGAFKNDADFKISIRNAFVPSSTDFILLSADYSQLELRILAHLCQDEKLISTLNSSGDVFRQIAAQLNNVSEQMVSDEMRQEAKGLTYGIIYGMGSKTLSEQLEVEEINASIYISQFMKTYPKVKMFIQNSITSCRQNGFVETLNGRRRYLEHINSRNIADRAQAERQAVNSRVQGSASDLVKIAMNRIQTKLVNLYPECLHPMEWNSARGASTRMLPQNSNIQCFPVLNLHDELIFEIKKTYLAQIAREIKMEMESCLDLSVQIPVVVKTGPTWAKLTQFEFI